MKIESCRFIVVGISLLALFPCLPMASAAEIYHDPARLLDRRVRDLLGRMTLEEKIDQLSQKGADGIAMKDGQADEASLQRLFGGRSIGVLCVRFGDDLFESGKRRRWQISARKPALGFRRLTVNEGLHGVLARALRIIPSSSRWVARGIRPWRGRWAPKSRERPVPPASINCSLPWSKSSATRGGAAWRSVLARARFWSRECVWHTRSVSRAISRDALHGARRSPCSRPLPATRAAQRHQPRQLHSRRT